MILRVPEVLTRDEVAALRAIVDAGDWTDGNATSGHQSALAKRNRQLPEDSAAAAQAGRIVLDALGRSALFVAAALPLKVYPPLFNRYERGDGFGAHVDGAVRIRRGSDFRVRGDLSATLFLTDPDAYDGGALISGEDGPEIRLPAGDMILYPASTLHRVTPVARGTRVACFFWVQSMIRDDAARATLFELDGAIQSVAADRGQADAAVIRLTAVYHNLLRRWADC